MKILIKRIYTCKTYTISHVYIDGAYVCDAIEDADRMLDQSMKESEILSKKVINETSIPTGEYNILMNVVSPKYSKRDYYKRVCHGGRVPRFEYVRGFVGVLFHVGNTASDSSGCILLGQNKVKGRVINSKMCFEIFYNKLYAAYKIGEKITCTIIRSYK